MLILHYVDDMIISSNDNWRSVGRHFLTISERSGISLRQENSHDSSESGARKCSTHAVERAGQSRRLTTSIELSSASRCKMCCASHQVSDRGGLHPCPRRAWQICPRSEIYESVSISDRDVELRVHRVQVWRCTRYISLVEALTQADRLAAHSSI